MKLLNTGLLTGLKRHEQVIRLLVICLTVSTLLVSCTADDMPFQEKENNDELFLQLNDSTFLQMKDGDDTDPPKSTFPPPPPPPPPTPPGT